MTRYGSVLTTASLLLVGCATTIPKELVNAKTAYGEASKGPAATLAPEELQDARAALNDAERSFGDTGASDETRRLAIEAETKAEAAQSRCRLVASQSPLPKVVTNTLTETVIDHKLVSLPANVLFAFDQSTLLPGATKHLNAAVEALRAAKADQKELRVVVEGHTDSIGTREYNQELSERRAKAVRDFLVAHGQDPSFVTVKAKGKDEPFTSNATQEGRANNRRVEIFVLKPENK